MSNYRLVGAWVIFLAGWGTTAVGQEELPATKPSKNPAATRRAGAAPDPSADAILATARGKAGYGIGMTVGQKLVQDGVIPEDLAALVLGIKDGLAQQKPRISQAQFQAAMLKFQEENETRLAEQLKAEGPKNLEEGKVFLDKNKTKKGVVVLPSGLQYEVLQQGKGPSPKKTDKVTTHYKGTLIDGTVFDSSYDRGEPVQFPVGEVISGWTEALQKMKVGDRWRLFIPANLAYGEKGSPPVIGPNEVLIFEVELINIL